MTSSERPEGRDIRLPHERRQDPGSTSTPRPGLSSYQLLVVAEAHPWLPLDQITPELARELWRAR